MNGELFPKDQYGVHKCMLCGSLGTIVELGACCRVAQLEAAWKAAHTRTDFLEPALLKRRAA